MRPKTVVCACGELIEVKSAYGRLPEKCSKCREETTREKTRRWKENNPEAVRQHARTYWRKEKTVGMKVRLPIKVSPPRALLVYSFKEKKWRLKSAVAHEEKR